MIDPGTVKLLARRGGLLLALLAAICVATVSVVQAELTAHGNLFVRFRGGIKPIALPRKQLAPISVTVGGIVRTLSGEHPPALRKIRIELNRAGTLDFHGLATCRYRQLVAAPPRRALEACGDALIGEGIYRANTAFPEQGAFPAHGHILAFNAIHRGQRAILAHVFGYNPVPITRIIVFRIHRAGGTYGTVITGGLSEKVNHYGYVEGILLQLHRRFLYRGRLHSYLSAACGAPPGFHGGLFPFARGSMTFDDGRTLTSTLVRSCRVRG